MAKQISKRKTKRVTCRKRYKIEKKVREHNKKLRKDAKKTANKRPKKDPGVPNSFPMKEEVLKQAEEWRRRTEEERQRQKERRKKDRQKVMDKKRNLESIVKDAQRRGAEFERKKAFVSEQSKAFTGGKSVETSLKAYYKEFSKVIEAADVVLQVLDARDPLGSRCPQVEEAVLSAGHNKKLVLVLNKIDLVPRENVEAWLKYLRNELPTVAFKASTQTQSENLSQSKVPLSLASDDLRKSSCCLGADLLMKLLGNYCRKKDIRSTITVGVVGFPNTGKSSLINSLKRCKACNVGATPGVTKTMQAVQLDKHVKLLDSPGIVMATGKTDAATILRNCVKVETVEDPTEPVAAILKRCTKQQLMLQYGLPEFSDVHEFLGLLARKQGRLRKGGRPNVKLAARSILQDWNIGKITYYTHPPEDQGGASQLGAQIVTQMGQEFDIEALLQEEAKDLQDLKTASDGDIILESQGPTQGMVTEADVGDDDDDDDEDDDEEEEAMEEEAQGTEELSNVKVTLTPGRSRRSSASIPEAKVKSQAAASVAGNQQLNAAKKKAFKKMKKDRKKRDKVAGQLSDALTTAFSGMGEEGQGASKDYDFSTDFQ